MVYHSSLYGLLPRDNPFIAFGWMGVDLFFVLSGFLIGGQLFQPFVRGDAPDYLRFFQRRLLRTVPAFAVMLAVYFLLPSWREQSFIQPLWQFLTFTQNLFIHAGPGIAFSHAWSLCVEEQFYLVFPLIVMLGARKPSARKFALIAGGVLLFGVAVRAYAWLHYVADPTLTLDDGIDWRAYMSDIYYPTWSRLDGLLAGVVLAAVRILRPQWWKRFTVRPNWLAALGIAGVAGTAWFFDDQIAQFWPAVFGYPLLAASIALIVAAGAEPRSLLCRLPVPGAATLAAAAYSLYLSHKMVFQAVKMAGSAHGLGGAELALLAFGAAFLAGSALYLAVERPFLQLRERITVARHLPVAAPTAATP